MRPWAGELTLPNVLSTVRLVLAPALILVAFSGRSEVVLIMLLSLQVTDWIDGPLARRSGRASATGARLDSLADAVMFASAVSALAVLEGDKLLAAWPWIGAAVLSYGLSVAFALARLGVPPSYHQWSAKISGPLTLLAVFAVLLFDVTWPVRVAAAAVTLGNVEAMGITWRLRAAATDVPSVFLMRRAGSETET